MQLDVEQPLCVTDSEGEHGPITTWSDMVQLACCSFATGKRPGKPCHHTGVRI